MLNLPFLLKNLQKNKSPRICTFHPKANTAGALLYNAELTTFR